jgi:Protein of unknown function (DUF1488)
MSLISSLKSMLSSGSSKTDAPQEVEITFPLGQQQTGDGITFAAIVNGWRVRCSITSEALQKRFGVPNQDLENGFLRNRKQIQTLIEQLARKKPSQNNYMITPNDP